MVLFVVDVIVGCHLLQTVRHASIVRTVLIQTDGTIGTKARTIIVVIVYVSIRCTHSGASPCRIQFTYHRWTFLAATFARTCLCTFPIAAFGIHFEFWRFLCYLKSQIAQLELREIFGIRALLTSTSVAVSESPLSLPSGKSCNSAEMHSGSSTEFREADFCDGMLRRDRTLMPDCERGICVCGDVPPSDDPSTSPNDLRNLVWASFKRLSGMESFLVSPSTTVSFSSRLQLTCNNPMHHELVELWNPSILAVIRRALRTTAATPIRWNAPGCRAY